MSVIGRASAAALLFFLGAAEASAATLVKPGTAIRASERGITVVRGAKSVALAAETPATPRATCPEVKVSVTTVWPERRFRQQGFWSGDGLVTASMRAARQRTTQGFYADRIAAGL